VCSFWFVPNHSSPFSQPVYENVEGLPFLKDASRQRCLVELDRIIEDDRAHVPLHYLEGFLFARAHREREERAEEDT
jgi:hypothetical protein